MLASVSVNLLLAAFHAVPSHMFQMCRFALAPRKQTAFYPHEVTGPPPHTHTQLQTPLKASLGGGASSGSSSGVCVCVFYFSTPLMSFLFELLVSKLAGSEPSEF